MHRIGLGVVLGASILGVVWLGWDRQASGTEFLLGGKQFSRAELAQIESAFEKANLSEFRVEGRRILVPVIAADQYAAAAATSNSLPAQFSAEFDRMLDRVNLFTSSEQRRELLEESRKARLAQILRSISEIEDAVVEWDRAKSSSLFRTQAPIAAHVSVKTKAGRELTDELVDSLKQFVSGAIAGAKPEDVTVVDMNTSRVHGRRTPHEVYLDRVKASVRQSTREYEQLVKRSLDSIPGAVVAVKVEPVIAESEAADAPPFTVTDLEPTDWGLPVTRNVVASRVSPARATDRPFRGNGQESKLVSPVSGNRHLSRFEPGPPPVDDGTETFDGGPRNGNDSSTWAPPVTKIQVSVAIPNEYYEAKVRQRGIQRGSTASGDMAFRAAVAQLKSETHSRVRQMILRSIPEATSHDAISIQTLPSAREPLEKSGQAPSFWAIIQTQMKSLQSYPHVAGVTVAVLVFLGAIYSSRRRPVIAVKASVQSSVSKLHNTHPSSTFRSVDPTDSFSEGKLPEEDQDHISKALAESEAAWPVLDQQEVPQFQFARILELDQFDFERLVAAVDLRQLTLSILDQSEPFKRQFCSRLPTRVQVSLGEISRSLGPIRVKDIGRAQQEIVMTLQDLVGPGRLSSEQRSRSRPQS